MGVEVEGVDGGRRESRDQVGVASRASTSIFGGGVWKAGRVVWRCACWMRERNVFVRDLIAGIFVVVMLFFACERKMVIQMFTCESTELLHWTMIDCSTIRAISQLDCCPRLRFEAPDAGLEISYCRYQQPIMAWHDSGVRQRRVAGARIPTRCCCLLNISRTLKTLPQHTAEAT